MCTWEDFCFISTTGGREGSCAIKAMGIHSLTFAIWGSWFDCSPNQGFKFQRSKKLIN